MYKEKIKTLLLVSLVVVSIFLTQQLWMDIPFNIMPSIGEDLENNSMNNDILSKIILPEKYIVHFGSNHTILYTDEGYNLWEKAKEIIEIALNNDEAQVTIVSNEQGEGKIFERSVEFHFPVKVPTYIFYRKFNIEDKGSLYEKVSNIEKIYIPLNGENYILFSDGIKEIKIEKVKFDTSTVSETIKKIEESNYDIYYSLSKYFQIDSKAYITAGVKFLPDVYVKSEIDTKNTAQIESIAKGFFDKDLDYIRKIEETDGSIIYLYTNEEGIKISSDGVLLYFNSLDRQVVERNLYVSLNTALNFIDAHMGWPENVYLSSIEEIEADNSEGYRFAFSYTMAGRPIIINKEGMQHSIEIEVFNEQVKTYRRYIRNEDKSKLVSINIKPIQSPVQILNQNFRLIRDNYIKEKEINGEDYDSNELKNEILSSINDIYLAYYDPCQKTQGEKIISIWVINVAGNIYKFDADTGEVLMGGR